MVKIIKGDLFSAKNSVLIQCISADLAMGAGIAVEFNKRFNTKNKIKSLVNSVSMKTYLIRGQKEVICLVTKEKYWHKPTLQRMKQCIIELAKFCVNHRIEKIAMPAIGCGLDRLNFKDVYQIIYDVFNRTSVDVEIYLK